MHRAATKLALITGVCLIVPGLILASGFPKLPQFPIIGGMTIAGDFNGDGKVDLLVVSGCSPSPCSNSTITFVRGDGKGRFQGSIVSGTAANPYAVPVAGDFNGDHKLDVAFVSQAPGQPTLSIAVALGNGDGTFGATTIISAAAQGYHLIAGDVNNDGKLDLVLGGNSMQVFLGNGDGTFQELAATGGAFSECVLADVNHDGKLDLVGGFIQLGNGDGTFQEAQTISGAGGCPAVADFNRDGNLDVVANSGTGLDLYLGSGDGTFRAPSHQWTSPMGDFLVADFNGDGKPDLLSSRGADINILLNVGNGKFQPAVGYLSLGGVLLADVNGDGRTDVIFQRSLPLGGSAVVPALAQLGGTFPLPRSFFVPDGNGASGIVAGDLNNDGKLDLLELNRDSLTWRGGHLNRLLGNGDGTFKLLPGLLTGGRDSNSMTLADLNGDGKMDVVVASGDSTDVLLGLGNGNFQSPLIYAIQSPWSVVALADFNGDGVLDVAVNQSLFARGRILLGNGDGTFRSGPSLPASFDYIVAGDFNRDGKQDLAAVTSNSVGILVGNGDGTFQPISVLRNGYTQSLIAADFNGDGELDLAGVGNTKIENTIVSVYLGNGDGTLQAARSFWVRSRAVPGGLVAADFDGDGRLDLAVSLSSKEVGVLPGDGAGGFQLPTLFPGGSGRLVAGDFDANGKQDLAVITSRNTVAVLLNQ